MPIAWKKLVQKISTFSFPFFELIPDEFDSTF